MVAGDLGVPTGVMLGLCSGRLKKEEGGPSLSSGFRTVVRASQILLRCACGFRGPGPRSKGCRLLQTCCRPVADLICWRAVLWAGFAEAAFAEALSQKSKKHDRRSFFPQKGYQAQKDQALT